MTPEERDLISGLFERMRSMGPLDKDRDADSLINQAVRGTPDAAYMLVQSVLVQEQALQQSSARIAELEEQVRDLEQSQRRAPSSGSGSFLGGLFGGSRPSEPDRPGGSVPSIGSRGAPPSSYGAPSGNDAGRGAPPWGAAGQQAPPAGGGGGGGFMRSAMATAAGVAGGMLAADAIRNMMGGQAGQAQAASSDATKSSSSESSPYEVNRQQDQSEQKQEPQYQDANNNDPGNYDNASWSNDDSSWGGDDGGMDV
jgi:hypothetical protein